MSGSHIHQRVGVRDVSLLVLNIKPLNPLEIILFLFYSQFTVSVLQVDNVYSENYVRGSSR
jgi:hypothetical protein